MEEKSVLKLVTVTLFLRVVAFMKWCLGFGMNCRTPEADRGSLPQLVRLCEELEKSTENKPLITQLRELKMTTCGLVAMVQELGSSSSNYDAPGAVTPANGYRSFVKITDRAADRAIQLLKASCKLEVLQELISFLKSLSTFSEYLVKLIHRSDAHSLYPPFNVNNEDYNKEVLELIHNVDLQSFYGRFIANQFDNPMQTVLKRISEIMVCYSEFYYHPFNVMNIFKVMRYLISDKARGIKYNSLVEHSDIDFVKGFWAYSESPFMMIPMRLTNPIAVSCSVAISKESVIIDGVEVRPKYPEFHLVKGRLLSKTIREGMSCKRRAFAGRSNCLIIHVHGGGFVSQSSESQEIFLRKWATSLDVPLFSLEYSLAPEAAFPKAVYQIFYSYCVAITCADEFLGSTAERVVLTGDSAGGNLILGAMQLCIERGVRLPDGLLLAYVPLLISVVPSPSRLLGSMDPLLPYGLMMRCAKSYITGDGSGDDLEALLDFSIPLDPLVSPYICQDQVLRKLPRISLYTSTLDPCLDDAVMFVKKLQNLGNRIQLDVAEGLPHGFLNLCWVDEKAGEAVRICAERISEMLTKIG